MPGAYPGGFPTGKVVATEPVPVPKRTVYRTGTSLYFANNTNLLALEPWITNALGIPKCVTNCTIAASYRVPYFSIL